MESFWILPSCSGNQQMLPILTPPRALTLLFLCTLVHPISGLQYLQINFWNGSLDYLQAVFSLKQFYAMPSELPSYYRTFKAHEIMRTLLSWYSQSPITELPLCCVQLGHPWSIYLPILHLSKTSYLFKPLTSLWLRSGIHTLLPSCDWEHSEDIPSKSPPPLTQAQH